MMCGFVCGWVLGVGIWSVIGVCVRLLLLPSECFGVFFAHSFLWILVVVEV